MAEGVNGGPARFYRRRSLAEQREAFNIATAEVAVLEAKAERVTAEAEAEVRINKLDVKILKLKQQEAKAAAWRRSQPQSVAIGSEPLVPPRGRTRKTALVQHL